MMEAGTLRAAVFLLVILALVKPAGVYLELVF